MPSRLLYNNPVCFLTTVAQPSLPFSNGDPPTTTTNTTTTTTPNHHLHIMTVSWLTCIDNKGSFFMALHQKRRTTKSFLSFNELQQPQYFTLSVACEGQEIDLINCGSTTGTDKITAVGLNHMMVVPGWVARANDKEGGTKEPAPGHSSKPLSKKQRRKQKRAEVLARISALGLKCHSRSLGHVICQVVSVRQVEEHVHVTASIVEAYVRPEYTRKNSQEGPLVYASPHSEQRVVPTALSFLGSKTFQSYRQ